MASRLFMVYHLVYNPDAPDVVIQCDTKHPAESVYAVLWGPIGGGAWATGGYGVNVHGLCQRGEF